MPQKLTAKLITRFLKTQDSHSEITVKTPEGEYPVYAVHGTTILCTPPVKPLTNNPQHFVFNTNKMKCDYCGTTKELSKNGLSASEQLQEFKHHHKTCTPKN